jgi:hypothetical protein
LRNEAGIKKIFSLSFKGYAEVQGSMDVYFAK